MYLKINKGIFRKMQLSENPMSIVHQCLLQNVKLQNEGVILEGYVNETDKDI